MLLLCFYCVAPLLVCFVLLSQPGNGHAGLLQVVELVLVLVLGPTPQCSPLIYAREAWERGAVCFVLAGHRLVAIVLVSSSLLNSLLVFGEFWIAWDGRGG
jgi:hypothetical protein